MAVTHRPGPVLWGVGVDTPALMHQAPCEVLGLFMFDGGIRWLPWQLHLGGMLLLLLPCVRTTVQHCQVGATGCGPMGAAVTRGNVHHSTAGGVAATLYSWQGVSKVGPPCFGHCRAMLVLRNCCMQPCLVAWVYVCSCLLACLNTERQHCTSSFDSLACLTLLHHSRTLLHHSRLVASH